MWEWESGSEQRTVCSLHMLKTRGSGSFSSPRQHAPWPWQGKSAADFRSVNMEMRHSYPVKTKKGLMAYCSSNRKITPVRDSEKKPQLTWVLRLTRCRLTSPHQFLPLYTDSNLEQWTCPTGNIRSCLLHTPALGSAAFQVLLCVPRSLTWGLPASQSHLSGSHGWHLAKNICFISWQSCTMSFDGI